MKPFKLIALAPKKKDNGNFAQYEWRKSDYLCVSYALTQKLYRNCIFKKFSPKYQHTTVPMREQGYKLFLTYPLTS
jgi:hypothetical protein